MVMPMIHSTSIVCYHLHLAVTPEHFVGHGQVIAATSTVSTTR